MPAPHPRMHGITHVPGGPDPIPGLELAAHPGDFSEYVSSLSDLVGYWRLGEGAPSYLDTSSFADAHLSKTSAGAAMDEDVTGALPAAQDDGAVEFNGTSATAGDSLVPAVTTRFQFAATAYTVSCWLKLNSDCAVGANSLIVGTYSPSNYGWMLAMFPGQIIGHQRTAAGGSPQTYVVGPAIALDEWVYIVATWDPSTGHQLFYNATLVDTDAGTTTVPALTMRVGSMNTGGPVYGSLDGSVDEVAIWSRVLTDDEIAGLYTRGVADTVGGGTTWRHGSGTPAAGLGDNGDYYLDTATGDVWFRLAGAWSKIWDEP